MWHPDTGAGMLLFYWYTEFQGESFSSRITIFSRTASFFSIPAAGGVCYLYRAKSGEPGAAGILLLRWKENIG
jgi:hypothetical protein